MPNQFKVELILHLFSLINYYSKNVDNSQLKQKNINKKPVNMKQINYCHLNRPI